MPEQERHENCSMKFTDARKLRELEESLLRPEVRRSAEVMGALLADGFFEFGRSGRVYDKTAILATVAESADDEILMSQFEARALAADVALVTYRSCRKCIDPPEELRALRCSIWRRAGDGWEMVFHQGTPTGATVGERRSRQHTTEPARYAA